MTADVIIKCANSGALYCSDRDDIDCRFAFFSVATDFAMINELRPIGVHQITAFICETFVPNFYSLFLKRQKICKKLYL